MDATTTQPTLLSAARNFIRKSAGTAVLAIAPLAAVSLAPEAEAQTIFGQMSPSGFSFANASGGNGLASGSFFTSALTETNGIIGVKFGYPSYNLTTNSPGGGQSAFVYFGNSSPPSGTLLNGSSFTVAYDFGITPGSGITITGWQLSVKIHADAFAVNQTETFTGSPGSYSGSGTFLVSQDLNNLDQIDVELRIDFNAVSSGNNFTVVMNEGANQGIYLNAIPEPSTYAMIFGLGALGFVIVRRSRRSRAA
jgi:hypothetical protein